MTATAIHYNGKTYNVHADRRVTLNVWRYDRRIGTERMHVRTINDSSFLVFHIRYLAFHAAR